ncbi:hypothetical protein C8R43DRAFT_1042936 [Mycena crocata]|nr:hypothetical protein C8R43DRAFT_1042936 [Mycena crocata]
MPLFGSSHNNDNKLAKPHHTTELEGTGYGAGATGTGVGRTHETYPTGTGIGGTHETYAGAPGHTGTVGMGEPGMGNPTHVGGHHVPAGTHGGMHNDGMMADQYGTGVGGPGAGGAAIPPAGAIANEPRSGGKMTGKIEHAVGSLVGSQSLKAKGIQKEREAQGLKVQSRELAEAERLEHEAGIRRERAVAHGAHPDNRHVGGMPGSDGTGGPGAYS